MMELPKRDGATQVENNQLAGTVVFLAIPGMSASTPNLCNAIAVVTMDTRDGTVTRETRKMAKKRWPMLPNMYQQG